MIRASLCALALLLAGCGGSASQQAPAIGGPVRTVAAPAPDVGAAVSVGADPSAVAVGFGAVWVVSRTEGSVTRVDVRSGRRRLTPGFPRTLRTGSGPVAVIAGEGAVWVAAADGEITRIDPSGDGARAVAAVPDPGGIAAGAGGVWVSSRSGASVTRLDPRSGAVSGAPIRVGREPGDLAVAGGSVWVADALDGTVSRIGPGVRRARRVRVGMGRTLGLTAGDGAVWVAASDNQRADAIALVRIDPTDGRVDGKPIRIAGGVPLDLAAAGGAVWTTDAGSAVPGRTRPASVLRVDPRAGAVAGRPVPVAGPAGVAADGAGVWVASATDATLVRIAPQR